jgi:multidrug resistance efflux pump
MNEFSGEITAEFVDIRFAFSGKISHVFKYQGEPVKKGDSIAVLDKKLLQIELDKELADYEKARADFDLFTQKHGQENADDTIKFLRTKQQSELNVAVKNSELAKFRIDQSELISPVDGIVIDTHGIASGLFVTPASNPITVLNLETLVFVIEVPQEELFQFKEERQMKIILDGAKEPIFGTQRLPTHGKKGNFSIPIPIPAQDFIFPGMTGQATFKVD